MNGILFKPDMIQASIEGRKTQTRRLSGLKEINKEPNDWGLMIGSNMNSLVWLFRNTLSEILDVKPPYQVGETVYIKEAWATEKRYNHIRPSEISDLAKIFYVSDGVGEWPIDLSIGRLRSPLHLPEEFARYFIKITDVRAERLQEITEEDALKEGITIMAGTHQAFAKNPATNKLELIGHPEPYTARYHYEPLWDSLNKDYPWESNAWVWVYTFVKLEA